MRATELLGSPVVDQDGETCGEVRDIRVMRQASTAGQGAAFLVVGLVLGGGRLAHAWGFAEGRASGPWLLRTLTARSAHRAMFLPAEMVLDWGPRRVIFRGRLEDLRRLSEVIPGDQR